MPVVPAELTLTPFTPPTHSPASASVYNVKSAPYLADGDGTTDDTSAIQAAINDAVEAGGGTVLLPVGTYKLGATLTLGDGVTLQGAGRASVLQPVFAVAGSPNRVIDNDWTSGNSDIVIRDLRIRRDSGNVQHAILLNGVTNLLISNVCIGGTPEADSGLIGISGIGPTTRLVSTNVRIEACEFSESTNYGVQFGTVIGGTITGCTFTNCYREVIGVEPESGETCSDISIVGNTIVGSATVGGSTTGLIITTVTSGGTVNGVTITGNVVDGGATPIASDPSPGVTILGGSGIVIANNVFRRCFGAGIQIGNASTATSAVVVSGNQVVGCNAGGNASPDGSGIKLRNATLCAVTGNYVKGSSHTESLSESSSAADNFIVGNMLLDTTRFSGLSNTTAVGLNKESGSDSLYVGADSQQPTAFGVNGGSSTTRALAFLTNRVNRWFIRASATAEGGSNVGSDLEFVARGDDGSNLGTVLTLIRSTTSVKFGTGPIGFYGTTPASKPTVTGSRGGNAALASLLTALATLGLITDSSSA